jgi:hypothetical protein
LTGVSANFADFWFKQDFWCKAGRRNESVYQALRQRHFAVSSQRSIHVAFWQAMCRKVLSTQLCRKLRKRKPFLGRCIKLHVSEGIQAGDQMRRNPTTVVGGLAICVTEINSAFVE